MHPDLPPRFAPGNISILVIPSFTSSNFFFLRLLAILSSIHEGGLGGIRYQRRRSYGS
jgi:hypothetical protein